MGDDDDAKIFIKKAIDEAQFVDRPKKGWEGLIRALGGDPEEAKKRIQQEREARGASGSEETK
jgi:hypothetical protein